MKTLTIIKRNRKYFSAKLENKYECKILIDENSEALEIGEHQLEVDDISVRSKYGTELIFKLSAPADQQKDAGICTLRAPFNKNLTNACHKLGGKWDGNEKAWIFTGLVSDQVEELDEKYNSKLIGIEVSVLRDYYEHTAPIYIAGFEIAKAFGRDSGAKLADGIAIISGKKPYSCGSMKNWATEIAEGTVFRMQMPELCLGDIDTETFQVIKI